MTRRTLLDFFADVAGRDRSAAGTAPRRTAPEFLVYDDGYRTWSWTYAEVARQAQAFAPRVATRGIVSGQAVAIWSENRPEWIVALWGALLEGVVLVPIDYRASSDFLAQGRRDRRCEGRPDRRCRRRERARHGATGLAAS